MPPKAKISKEEILRAVVALVRKSGEQAINARNIASILGCSTQPVFSNFATMEELRAEVIRAAEKLCGEYLKQETEKGVYPLYKANGMAYIRFAKEEKELFKLLYMRDRSRETNTQESVLWKQMTEIVQENTGLTENTTALFHLEMWAYVHGIATMFATSYLEIEWEVISKMLTDVYQGLRKQYGIEG